MNPGSVVAIVELGAPPGEAAAALAPDLGTTTYELKLLLSAGLPAIVLMTPDGERARVARDAIAARGHRAVVSARSDVVSSEAMTALRDFRFEGAALVANAGDAERLPLPDVLALVRASHRTTTQATTTVKERKFRPVMAVASGGLVISKTTTREVTSRTDEREQVLYLFRRSGAPPFILREHSARYGGLGADAGRTTLENFATTIRRLRELCPTAAYDERLVSARAVRGVADGIDAADLLAYLVAMSVA